MNKQLSLENPIQELLDLNGFKKITEFDALKQYFDVNLVDEEKTPTIKCNKKVVIVFDNETYNETYLLDVMVQYLSTREHLKKSIEFVYIDSFDVRRQLFAETIYNHQWNSNNLMPRAEFEKNYLQPGIMIINPTLNQISFFKEKIAPISIEGMFESTKIEE